MMAVIPDKDTSERDAEGVHKSKLLLNVSHMCDKSRAEAQNAGLSICVNRTRRYGAIIHKC